MTSFPLKTYFLHDTADMKIFFLYLYMKKIAEITEFFKVKTKFLPNLCSQFNT